jgi:signal transduction histidine kinase
MVLWPGPDMLEQREQQLKEAVADLTRERETRAQLIALISHDLRTPLSAARMGAYLVAQRAGDEGAVRAGASRITGNIDRADAMIRDLLDVSRIRAGETLPLDLQPCELFELVSDTLVELSAIYGERFVLRGDEHVDGVWSCAALRRIVENLCNNAVKYGDSEQPITVTLARREHEIELCVHNFGVAIPAVDLPYVFEPFRGSHSARAGRHRGWGLGLTLVKGFAEAHGGRAAVESSAQEGTTFRVTLPRVPR